MNTYIGIDLGTSGLKLLLVDRDGKILAENTQNYDVIYPQNGWTEQNPADWWNGVKCGLSALLEGQNKALVSGISFGGQMHGLVALDKDDNVIRPCILWNDGRTEEETKYLNEVFGKEKLSSLTGNIAFAGFTAPKILWMKNNEPENFEKIAKIMLPKDYLAYLFSGVFSSDLSDASGMLLLDVKNRTWSKEMCDLCGISSEVLPSLYESYEVVGNIKPEIANEFGLSKDVKIIAGAGDNAAAAVGTGCVTDGSCNVSLGTSGTIFLSAEKYSVDSKNALHSFCHSNGKWHLMGCILSAASCRKWWVENIFNDTDYNGFDAASEDVCTEGVYFLPYLSGERSPHNDVKARGAFIGLSATTTKAQMSRAVMEGVAFAIRDCLEVALSNGVCPSSTKLCGGGAKSRVWCQIFSDVLNLPVYIPKTEQGPAYGAAILAMVGSGEYKSVEEATENIIEIKSEFFPNPDYVSYYNKKYKTFTKLYPALKGIEL